MSICFIVQPRMSFRCEKTRLALHSKPAQVARSLARSLASNENSDGGAQLQRHPIYWIDECAPHNRTRETAASSALNLPKFLANKGVAPYNAEAFEEARAAYTRFCFSRNLTVLDVPLLLDSCCGTGRSTWNLAKLRPDAFIIGVDKSLTRLARNAAFRERMSLSDADFEKKVAQDDDDETQTGGASTDTSRYTTSYTQQRHAHQRENMILVRANCVDFWRLLWESDLTIESHTILYPNPYPKAKQHTLRWHGSPAFPILLYMGASIEVRASWRTYLEEMAIAVDEIRHTGPLKIEQLIPGQNMGAALSNFEQKYMLARQPIYRLTIPPLHHMPRTSLAAPPTLAVKEDARRASMDQSI